ncbi:MAG: hypothetical protein IJ365_03195 [Clostridia bacterium]|nr:hypothetical protein [Clostridia bacterium]
MQLKSDNCYLFDSNTVNNIVSNITNMSPYAFEYQLGGGYLTLPGGHRVGICGSMQTRLNGEYIFKEICSINIRVCKSKIVYDEEVFSKLHTQNSIYNTCIVSPPKCGKTTFLKNYIIYLSKIMPQVHICVADEREELCGGAYMQSSGVMGHNTSFISACSKIHAAEMFVRCMSPGVVIFDEVWSEDDFRAVENVFAAGVGAVFSIHGTSFDTVSKRKELEHLLPYIHCYADISCRNGVGTIEQIGRVAIGERFG